MALILQKFEFHVEIPDGQIKIVIVRALRSPLASALASGCVSKNGLNINQAC